MEGHESQNSRVDLLHAADHQSLLIEETQSQLAGGQTGKSSGMEEELPPSSGKCPPMEKSHLRSKNRVEKNAVFVSKT